MITTMPAYRENLALVHDLGFGFHAERTAPGVLALLEPVRARGGVVHEFGCGTGLLTRHLLDAGHTVIASDASQAMLDRARSNLGPDVDLRRIALPDDPLPPSDAVVSVGHALNYLPDERSVHRALTAVAGALRPGGVLAIDLLDLAWGDARRNAEPRATVTENYAIFARYSLPAPDTYVRDMTTFVPAGDGYWRRDDERHANVLVDTSAVPGVLAAVGVTAEAGTAFGAERLPPGLVTIIGRG